MRGIAVVVALVGVFWVVLQFLPSNDASQPESNSSVPFEETPVEQAVTRSESFLVQHPQVPISESSPDVIEADDEITLQECIDADLNALKFARGREKILQEFFKSLHQANIEPTQILDILSVSDENLYQTAILSYTRPDYARPLLVVSYENTTGKLADNGELVRDVNWAYKHDYPAIISALSRGELDPDYVYAHFDLLTLIFAANPQISENTVSQLLSAGLRPTLANLVILTQQGRSQAILETVLSFANGLDYNHKWGNDSPKQNLLILALKNKQTSLAQFWLDKGNSPFFQQAEFSALDVIAKPSNQQDLQLLVTLTRRFAAEQTYPNDLSKLPTIRAWLPESVQTELEDYFAVGMDKLNKLRDNEYVKKLQQHMDELNAQYGQHQLGEGCLQQPSYADYRHQRNKVWNTKRYEFVNSPLWVMQSVNRFDADSWKEDDSGKKPIRNLLTSRKHWDELKSRLDNGERLPSDAAFILAMNNQAEMMRDLLGYGLDLHATDPEGNSVWHSAVLGLYRGLKSNDFGVMNILIENQVDIHKGRDIIIYLLEVQGNMRGVTDVLSFLNGAGAELTKQQYNYLLFRFKGYSPNLSILRKWFEERLDLDDLQS